jgi:hypothetical protein
MNLENAKAKRMVELCVQSCRCSFVNPRIIYMQLSLGQENFTYLYPTTSLRTDQGHGSVPGKVE